MSVTSFSDVLAHSPLHFSCIIVQFLPPLKYSNHFNYSANCIRIKVRINNFILYNSGIFCHE